MPGALAALVDDGEIAVQPRRERPRAQHAAHIGRHDHQVAAVVALLDVAAEQGRGVQVVDRDVEEPLDLSRVQIHRQHAVGAGLGDQVGHQLGRDRRARRGLPVLPRVAEIRHHRGDPPRRTPAQRVQRDQQFHQRVVGGIRRGLHHEHVLAADVLVDLDEHLHVGKAPDRGAGQRQLQRGGNRLGERTVAVAGNDFHAVRPPKGSSAGSSHRLDAGLAAFYQRLLRLSKPARPARARTDAVITSFTPPAASVATTMATSAQ